METRAVGKFKEAASHVHLSDCISSEAYEHKYVVNLYSTLLCRVVPNLEHSTRHSVTSRIDLNSRALSHLTFSTRHLNATLEKRENVEKFNTWRSPFRRFRFIPQAQNPPPSAPRKNFNERPRTTSVGLRWLRKRSQIFALLAHVKRRRKSQPQLRSRWCIIILSYINTLGLNQARLINLPAAHTKSGVNFWNAN
jgi:hypothetical protein